MGPLESASLEETAVTADGRVALRLTTRTSGETYLLWMAEDEAAQLLRAYKAADAQDSAGRAHSSRLKQERAKNALAAIEQRRAGGRDVEARRDLMTRRRRGGGSRGAEAVGSGSSVEGDGAEEDGGSADRLETTRSAAVGTPRSAGGRWPVRSSSASSAADHQPPGGDEGEGSGTRQRQSSEGSFTIQAARSWTARLQRRRASQAARAER